MLHFIGQYILYMIEINQFFFFFCNNVIDNQILLVLFFELFPYKEVLTLFCWLCFKSKTIELFIDKLNLFMRKR